MERKYLKSNPKVGFAFMNAVARPPHSFPFFLTGCCQHLKLDSTPDKSFSHFLSSLEGFISDTFKVK